MKKAICTLLALSSLLAASALKAEDGWVSLFNGKDLTGWKSNWDTDQKNEMKAEVFTVKEGEIEVNGGRSHLFYVGPVNNHVFKNFELKAKVKTQPGANSGIYFHTDFEPNNWPSKGFECQVNQTHKDIKKTGGLYAVKDVLNTSPVKDEEWYDYDIKVEGKHVVLSINGQVTSDWTQPDDWDPTKSLKNMDGRKLGEGTFALQGHDPKSVTHYKDIFVKVLP